jgi:hypothetical protein
LIAGENVPGAVMGTTEHQPSGNQVKVAGDPPERVYEHPVIFLMYV